ncbi:hypothetical protein JW758_01805 [Candidatus Peregrinibacteria bacterium]|nr:hypothetical protein [Candidatus Peregrinibacteria bacterium]
MIKNKAFSFAEVIITVSLFFIIAGVGIGAYFEYYKSSLIKTDISNTFEIIKNTRYKALKNPTNSDYGIYIDPLTRTLTSFKDIYNPANPENVTFKMEQLDITDLNIYPNLGVTNEIIFEAQTAKTLNYGSFTISNGSYSNNIYITSQGVVE